MSKKVSVEKHKNRKSPYRVKCGNLYVYLSTKDEAERVRQYTQRVLTSLGGV